MSNHAATSNSNQGAGPWRVLLVSDNLIDQKLLVGLLGRQRHQVVVISDGAQALIFCSKNECDAVILDSVLSTMDSAKLIRDIREHASGSQRLPIIVLAEEKLDCDRCLQAGADRCLSRPLQIVEFHESVRAIRDPTLAGNGGEPRSPDSINWQVALDAVGGRRDLLSELIEMFDVEYPLTLGAIQKAIDAGDAKRLQMSAHQLKGCLRYFGTTEASDLAGRMEEIGRSGNLDGASMMMAPLASAVQRLVPLLRQGPN